MKKIAAILLAILPAVSSADVVKASGTVKEVWFFAKSYGTYDPSDVGLAMIYIDSLQGACGTGERRIAITTDHPLYKSVVSTALMAKTTGSPIEIWHLGTCNIRSSAWDFGLLQLK